MSLIKKLNDNLARSGVSFDDLKTLCAELGYSQSPLLLHGSVLTERFDGDSDIDVLICTAGVNAVHVLAYIGQQRIDVAVLGPERLFGTIDHDSKNGHDGLARTVLNGYPIAGNWGVIREFAESRTTTMPPFDSVRSKNLVVGTLHELRPGRRGHLERIGQAYQLVDVIASALLRCAGHWATTGPVLLRRLEQHDPEAAIQLNNAFRAFLLTETIEPFLTICREHFGVNDLRHQPLVASL